MLNEQNAMDNSSEMLANKYNITSEVIEKIIESLKKATLCRYYYRKKFDESFQENEKLEEVIRKKYGTMAELSETELNIYYFKENFLKLKGKNPFNAKLEDYSNEEIIEYLDSTFPYCFNVKLEECLYNPNVAILFYAMSLGLKPEYYEKVIEHLKDKKYGIESKVNSDNIKRTAGSFEDDCISIDSIVRKYF